MITLYVLVALKWNTITISPPVSEQACKDMKAFIEQKDGSYKAQCFPAHLLQRGG